MTTLANIFTPAVRQWIYGVLLVAVPGLILYGVVNAEQAAFWLAFGGAILGQGTALVSLTAQKALGVVPGKAAAKAPVKKAAPPHKA